MVGSALGPLPLGAASAALRHRGGYAAALRIAAAWPALNLLLLIARAIVVATTTTSATTGASTSTTKPNRAASLRFEVSPAKKTDAMEGGVPDLEMPGNPRSA